MPVYQLGNGNDYFNSANQPDWTNGSAVLGGNGDDTIITVPLTFFPPTTNIFVDGGNGDDFIQVNYEDDSTALGGNGDDAIQIYGGSNSTAFGDNGNDTLTSSGGLGNTLIGGNGDDTLISSGGGSGIMRPGNTLTGGPGRDTFQFANDGDLAVTNDLAGDGVVSDGDTFKGPIDVITDYQRGEHIGLRDYGATTDTPLARVDSVALVPELYTYNYNVPPISLFRPAIGSSEYAVFHGTFAGGNTFTVGADGPDLFVLYDTRTGPFELVGKGSLVLQGVTDERLLTEALSPATAHAPGGWDYSSFDQGGDVQDAAMSAVLDPPSGAANLLGVTPA